MNLLAGDEGFEPPNVGFKGRCLTAWRIPCIASKLAFWCLKPYQFNK